jgi:hypothetical protein
MSKRSEKSIKKEDLDALTVKDYNAIVKEYHRESDRAAAVLASCYLELFTAKFLWKFIRSEITNDEFHNLFNNYGPFSTFSARIDVAYAFGLINKTLRDDLKIIKDIRNQFSHKYKLNSFSQEPIKKWCKELVVGKDAERFPESAKKFAYDNPRYQYLISISMSVACMRNRMIKNRSKKRFMN